MGKITDYPSITNIGNDTILLGDGSSGTGKVAASELAQYALEEYAGSTVGGAAQSAKAALDNMSKGVIGYASGMNLDAMNTESVCGVYWINLEDSTLSGTKPGSSGQGMIFVKKQTENLFRQVYVPVTEGADYKSRYYSHSAGTWSAWAYTPMGTAINTVFGTTTIKTLTASDNLLTLAVGHYRINNAVPINAPDSSLKYGYVTIQNRGVNGYTYYEYAVGNGNGTSFKVYHGWKASSSATTIDWAEKKIYDDISNLNSNFGIFKQICRYYDTSGMSGSSREITLTSGCAYLVVLGKLNSTDTTRSGAYIVVAHSIASSVVPLTEVGSITGTVTVSGLTLTITYATSYTLTSVFRIA